MMVYLGRATLFATIAILAATSGRYVFADDQPQTGATAGKPIAVLAVASVEEVLNDIAYVTETAGQGDMGKMITLLSGGYTRGVDKKRPMGLVVTIPEDEPKAFAFLPVKNLNTILEGLEEQIGKPEDAGNGVLELGGNAGNPVYVREANGWAFIAQKANDLETLPDFDPAAVVADLTKNYTIGLRINVSNIPAEMKKVAVAQLKSQFERQLAEQLDDQPEDQRALSERYMRTMLTQLTSFIEDTEHVAAGLQIDSQAKETHVDFALVARPDTKLAAQMDLLNGVTSLHGGFLTPEGAVNGHTASRMSDEDVTLYQDILKTARENALKEIESDEDIETEEARQIARDVVNALFDVAQATVAAGKVDAGATLFLSPEGRANLVAGGTVKDAKRLEETFKKLVEAAKNEPKAPKVTFDADQHSGMRFHTMSLPIEAKEEEARKLFGENLDVAIGFGDESVYVAFGPDGLATTRKLLDDSEELRSNVVPPGQFIVALGPILKFASAVKDDPVIAALAATLDNNANPDHNRIAIKAQSVENGVRYRLEVEQGVLELIGAAMKMSNRGGNDPLPDFF